MCKKQKNYEQQKREERIAKLSSASSVALWLTDALELSDEQKYRLDIDPITKQATLHSTYAIDDISAGVNAADLIGYIICALKELEDLAKHGCVILYKQKRSPVVLCNKSLTNAIHSYDIEEELLWKYIDYYIVPTSKLEDYIRQGYMYLPDYLAAENLKASKRNLYFAIASMIISVIGSLVSIAGAYGMIKC